MSQGTAPVLSSPSPNYTNEAENSLLFRPKLRHGGTIERRFVTQPIGLLKSYPG